MSKPEQVRLLITLYEIAEKCEWKQGESIEQIRARLNEVMGIANTRLAEFENELDKRVKCTNCNADYASKWSGTTCIVCDGTIGGSK